MSKKYYDEFSREPVEKMAQSIANMTFAWESTRVPKSHYKKCLEAKIMELASSDTNIEMSLLKPYYDMIETMLKENKKYFFKALLMHETKTTYKNLDSIKAQALSITWDYVEDHQLKRFLSDSILSTYTNFLTDGIIEDISKNQ